MKDSADLLVVMGKDTLVYDWKFSNPNSCNQAVYAVNWFDYLIYRELRKKPNLGFPVSMLNGN